ncbi:hypothetical protein A8F94_20355 [Bacillus sp. FJAT-27225]|uniref:hypothetical protein n=1 Tax=Bacillus sp. FJAT-27225 TaxID=1743144 RepID=UPI00080C305D|nr:hypothetical protein [Bacillus sp. FJAT-27225]OCA82268.1 hypothetical protein A8F94_20355 [Bacillus sp. FJAT-27225]
MAENEKNEHVQEVNQQDEKQEESNQQDEKVENKNYSLTLALIGGAVGVGIGLLSSQGSGKKAIKSLSESEFFKTTSQELKKAANEILTDQAQKGIKQIASSYLGDSQMADPSKYEEIKEENKQLNNRLDRIESMLGQLTEAGAKAN